MNNVPLDSRPERLRDFLESFGCPTPLHVHSYLNAADRHQIDYRILPAISVIESTCGKRQRLNNHWGWNNAVTGFDSVESGIDYVAGRLSNSPYYRDKDLEDMLFTYNPYPDYVRAVIRLMRRIDGHGLESPQLVAAR